MKLIDELRERTSAFECATYKALQAGSADKHQQQAAASGIVIAHAKFDKAATALTMMQDRMKETRETLWQYESDLLRPPEGASLARRLERVRSVIAKLGE